MTTQPSQQPRRFVVAAGAVRQAFWVLALGVIVCYAFFAALGAFSPGDVGPVSAVVAALVVLWIVHAWLGRQAHAEHDPRVRSARERRGF